MARPVSDDTRREEILRRAKLGLREDIDDLRAELLDALPDYEQRLRRHTHDLPEWLELAPARLRRLFHFDDDSVEAQGVLGPRTVALGAGHVEAFVEQWLEPDAISLDEPQADELAGDYFELVDYLDALEAESERVAAEAGATLAEWLDGILSQLDMRRESDVEALEALVREGEVGRGDGARQEIADLWEEQRARAADLQARWEPIVALLDEGIETSEQGIEELRELVGRARDGLVGANEELEERLVQERPQPESDDSETPDEADEIDEAGPTELDVDAGETLRPGELSADHDASEADEEPAEPAEPEADDEPAEPDEPEEPEEPAEPEEPEEPEEPDEPEEPAPQAPEIDQASDTIPDADFAHGIVPLEEPSSEPEMSTLETSSVSDYSEPELGGQSSTTEPPASRRFRRGGAASEEEEEPDQCQNEEDAAAEDLKSEESDADERPVDEETPAQAESVHERETLRLDAADSEPAENEPAESEEADDQSAPASGADALEAPCFRMREGYVHVSGAEVAGVLLPPVVFLIAMGAACAMYLLGVDAGFNPIERWSWAPAALTVAGAWLFFVPLGLSWRPRWSGWRLEILRHTDVRQDAELYVDATEICVGEFCWPLDTLETRRLYRWDSPADDAFGWLLRIDPPGHPPVEFAAAETDRKQWQNSPVELVDFPYEAWLLAPHTFMAFRKRLLPHKNR